MMQYVTVQMFGLFCNEFINFFQHENFKFQHFVNISNNKWLFLLHFTQFTPSSLSMFIHSSINENSSTMKEKKVLECISRALKYTLSFQKAYACN
jgi:hypothetical protein